MSDVLASQRPVRRRRLPRWPLSLARTLTVLAGLMVAVATWRVGVAVVMPEQTALASSTERWVVLVFFLTIFVGELNRISLPGTRQSAPMSVAGAYALAMSSSVQGERLAFGSAVCIVATAAGMAAAAAVQVSRDRPAHVTEVVVRLLSGSAVALMFRSVPVDHGRPLALLDWSQRGWALAVAMVVVSGVALVLQGLLTALVEAADQQVPWRTALGDELGDSFGLSTALAGSGALIALAEAALGVVAVPIFLIPVILTQFALRRYAGIRATYRQTIRTLSRLTEVGGYTRPAHPARVAELSVEMGRVLGVPAREAASLEYAALLHDIGQLALRTPIPQGATMMAAPADQDRIAQDGADIVRTTGVLDDVAGILEVQAKPYRHVRELGENIPLAARIIKVANAYDDLAGESPTEASRAAAIERIHLGLGYEYDPSVVEALERVLQQRRESPAVAPLTVDLRP